MLCSLMEIHQGNNLRKKPLHRTDTIKGSLRGKRKICGWDESAFERLLAGFADV
jgi:hypothetical protein